MTKTTRKTESKTMRKWQFGGADVPVGYIPGMGRNDGEENLVTHLYKGTFDDPGLPMCIYGWNRSDGHRYSIFRNNVSSKGICLTCLRRAKAGLDGVQPTTHKTKWL